VSLSTPPGAPPTPTGLVAVSGTSLGQILLGWSPATGAQSYLLQRSLNSGSGYSGIATASGTSYNDNDPTLAAGKTYYYELAAANTSGTSAYSTPPASATPYVPPTFGGWDYRYFGQNAPASQAADTATPENDGITNLMKYALGLNPMIAYNGTSAGLPVAGLLTSGSNRYLTLTFTGTAPDLSYTVEATGNLTGSWSMLQSWAAGTPPGTQTVSDTVSLTSTTARFINLKVNGP
jgi:hypothetical protein